MSFVGRVVHTIVACCFLIGSVQPTTANNFTIEQYIGKWYQVGLLLPGRQKIICERFDTKIDDKCVGCFIELYGKLPNGEDPPRVYGSGTIIDSKIQIYYPTLGRSLYSYTVMSYNYGDDLLLHDTRNIWNSKLLSRSVAASIAMKSEFAKIGRKAGLHDVYVEPQACMI